MKKQNATRLFSLLLVLLLLAVPLLSSCNGEMPEATTPPTGGGTNEGTGCVTNEGTGGVISKDATVGNVWKQYVTDSSETLGIYLKDTYPSVDSKFDYKTPRNAEGALAILRGLEAHVVESSVPMENWDSLDGRGELYLFGDVDQNLAPQCMIGMYGNYLKIVDQTTGASRYFRLDLDLRGTIIQVNELMKKSSDSDTAYEWGAIAWNEDVGSVWRTYIADPNAEIAALYSRVGLTMLSSISRYSTQDTEAIAAILEELRGLEEHVIGVFEPNQKWWENMELPRGGLTFYVTGEAMPACNVWMDKNVLRVSTLESRCFFLLDFDTAEVTEAIQTLVGRDTGTINGFLPAFG